MPSGYRFQRADNLAGHNRHGDLVRHIKQTSDYISCVRKGQAISRMKDGQIKTNYAYTLVLYAHACV